MSQHCEKGYVQHRRCTEMYGSAYTISAGKAVKQVNHTPLKKYLKTYCILDFIAL